MKIIDMENWDRKGHFDFFYRMDYPHYSISANIDITNFYKYIKSRSLPFYYSMIYCVMKASDSVENLRYRIRDGKVVLHERLHPSFTDDSEGELFKFITSEMKDSLEEFVEYTRNISLNQESYFNFKPLEGRDDFFYISSIPWISFTQITHTINFNKNDSVPRISWGKYFKEGDKILLPFSMQVNHALVDGLHLGKYYETLQFLLNKL